MKQDLHKFFKNKKIFVTGHTGFKGSWLSLWLEKMEAKVCGYALKPDAESLYNVAKLQNIFTKSVFDDIRNAQILEQEIKQFQPEILIHMAAQPLVRASYANPKETYETNVIGTLNVFEAARKSGSVKTILNITTDKCYENKEIDYAYKESDPMGGHDPYSSSKACAEILTASYRSSFFANEGINLASARAGNVIGGGDFSVDRIIPDIFKAIRAGKEIEIRSPNAIRPWQHVLEPVYGYLLLTKLLHENGKNFSKAYNFGPNAEGEVNVENLTKNFIAKFGNGSYKISSSPNLHEAKLLKLNNSLAKTELKWLPSLNFEETIAITVDWYKNYLQNPQSDIKSFTQKQIENFIKK